MKKNKKIMLKWYCEFKERDLHLIAPKWVEKFVWLLWCLKWLCVYGKNKRMTFRFNFFSLFSHVPVRLCMRRVGHSMTETEKKHNWPLKSFEKLAIKNAFSFIMAYWAFSYCVLLPLGLQYAIWSILIQKHNTAIQIFHFHDRHNFERYDCKSILDSRIFVNSDFELPDESKILE